MALIADVLMIAAALAAAVYCHVLSRRLRRLQGLDGGVGAAIAQLSTQVKEMNAALEAAKSVSGESTREMAQRTARAEIAAGRLELLLAALHERDASARPAKGAPAGGAPAGGPGAGAAARRTGAAPAPRSAPSPVFSTSRLGGGGAAAAAAVAPARDDAPEAAGAAPAPASVTMKVERLKLSDASPAEAAPREDAAEDEGGEQEDGAKTPDPARLAAILRLARGLAE